MTLLGSPRLTIDIDFIGDDVRPNMLHQAIMKIAKELEIHAEPIQGKRRGTNRYYDKTLRVFLKKIRNGLAHQNIEPVNSRHLFTGVKIRNYFTDTYLNCLSLSRDLRQARLASLPALRQSRRSLPGCTSGRLQSQTQEELDALLQSVLARAFKGEL